MVQASVYEVVQGGQRKNWENDGSIVNERVVLFLIKVCYTAGPAQIEPRNDYAHHQNVEKGNQKAENLVSDESLRSYDFSHVWLHRVIIEYALVLIPENGDSRVVK